MRDWSRMRVEWSMTSRPLDQPAVEADEPVVRLQRAAAFVLPGAGHRRQAGDREKIDRAVALAREAVADARI